MNYVLDKEKQEEFIKMLISEAKYDDSIMNEYLDGCKYYYHKIYGNTYFLSKSHETEIRKEANVEAYISEVYRMVDECNFELEEICADFIDYILQSPSNSDLTLDENLVAVHTNYISRYE